MKFLRFWFAAMAATLAAGSAAAQQNRPANPAVDKRAAAKEYLDKHGAGEGRLKPGDAAPDFNLKKRDATERVRLADFKGKKPVALVFGSYT